MKITIITTSYNSGQTIRDTLKSVAGQSYTNIEHIIIDGKSKDNTLDIVREFPHVSKVISEPDKGIYDAMNKGIDYASGEIIAILNSDDFYEDHNVILNVVNAFTHQKVDSVYGDLQYVNESNINKIVRVWIAKPYKRSKFLNGWMPPHPSFFLRKEIYNKFGKFNTALKSAADYELMLRMLFKQKITTHYIPKVLVRMRTGGQSNQSIKNRLSANAEDRKAWEINGLKPRFYTILLKPIRKMSQYFIK